jgi:hypothetical protein
VAYRRYVLEKAPSESYARYFGLDIETLRQWFELQFTEEINGTTLERHGNLNISCRPPISIIPMKTTGFLLELYQYQG